MANRDVYEGLPSFSGKYSVSANENVASKKAPTFKLPDSISKNENVYGYVTGVPGSYNQKVQGLGKKENYYIKPVRGNNTAAQTTTTNTNTNTNSTFTYSGNSGRSGSSGSGTFASEPSNTPVSWSGYDTSTKGPDWWKALKPSDI